ncbi:MAG: tetratricopeptide repeat protein [Firmicutes bacterium]|nr:tetratricopeptide repeat protein [Bacillota bacterium]
MASSYITEHSNQLHQLLVSVSRHFYVKKDGFLAYQEKPVEVDLKRLSKTQKELLVYYIVRDHFSGNFVIKLTTSTALIPLVEFLHYAWSGPADDKYLWGLPDFLWIPKTIATPDLFEGLEILGVIADYPPSGFASGIRIIPSIEEQLFFIMGRLSEPTLEIMNQRLDKVYRYMLNLNFSGNKVEKWRKNLPPRHPKNPPEYREFMKFFMVDQPEKHTIPLLPPAKILKFPTKSRAKSPVAAARKPRLDRAKLEKAQDIVYEAWELPDRRKRLLLARQALQISPYCADAYNLLAAESEDLWERIELYQKAVEAGKVCLGEDCFKEDVGHFWGLIETRPFMRAMEGLARCYWAAGRGPEAIEIYREMLRLNPGDNQGVRYSLIACLLEEARWDEAEAFLKEYGDEVGCHMAYSRALLSFVVSGKGGQSDVYLREAFKRNRFVPSYLIGEKYLPFFLPAYYGLGDENEAIVYADLELEAWKKVPGALEWVREIWR